MMIHHWRTATTATALLRRNAARVVLPGSSASSAASMAWMPLPPPSSAAATARFSTVPVPDPPTSNHGHSDIPNAKGRIVYTETDEAPALATYSLYPVVRKFSAMSDVDVVPCDISVAGRVLGAFPEKLKEEQRIPDNL